MHLICILVLIILSENGYVLNELFVPAAFTLSSETHLLSIA